MKKSLNESQKQEISAILKNYLEEESLLLKEIVFNTNEFVPESTDQILQISISSTKDENISLDKIVAISKLLNTKLENSNNFDMTKLGLDISSSGIEKTINNLTELNDNLDKYVFVELKDNNSYQGKLININDNEITLSVNFKGQFRKVKFDYNEAKFMRKAISVKKEIDSKW